MSDTKTPHPGMGFIEFVALVAALMATNALGIDTMLPALQDIGSAMGVQDGNKMQWIVLAYMLGFGVAQLFYGTLIDRYGRKSILLVGMAGYVLCSLAVACTHSFTLVVTARALQGVAAAASRVVSVAIVRDNYVGRSMARVVSLSFMVFMGVPILAPSIGQAILFTGLSWRWIFIGMALFGGAVLAWVATRLPETLHPEDRHPIDLPGIVRIFRQILTCRLWLGYSLGTAAVFGSLMGFIVSSQQVFLFVFKAPNLFPLVFAGIASCIAAASLANARLVGRLGMRVLSHAAMLGFVVVAAIHAVVAYSGYETLWSFAILQGCMMFCFGLLMGNFNAIAMEPVGHMAGTAASAMGFVTTVGGAGIGYLVGQSFNGTDIPLTIGFFCAGLATMVIILITERGRLFNSSLAAALV